MSKISLTISQGYRYFFYAVLSLSLLTGSSFWLIRRFGMVEGDFGPESHFLQYPLLQVHGFAAFLMMMSLGAIFASHIPKTWASKRSRQSGITLLVWVVISILTAYSLYYLVSEDWHEWLGNGHALFGVSLPVVLMLHIWFARKPRRIKQQRYIDRKNAKREKREKRRLDTTEPALKQYSPTELHTPVITATNTKHINARVSSAMLNSTSVSHAPLSHSLVSNAPLSNSSVINNA